MGSNQSENPYLSDNNRKLISMLSLCPYKRQTPPDGTTNDFYELVLLNELISLSVSQKSLWPQRENQQSSWNHPLLKI